MSINLRLLDQASNMLSQRIEADATVLDDVTALNDDVMSLQHDVAELHAEEQLQGGFKVKVHAPGFMYRGSCTGAHLSVFMYNSLFHGSMFT